MADLAFVRLRAGTYFGSYEAGFNSAGQWVSVHASYLRPAVWLLARDQAAKLARYLMRQGHVAQVVTAQLEPGAYPRVVQKGRLRERVLA